MLPLILVPALDIFVLCILVFEFFLSFPAVVLHSSLEVGDHEEVTNKAVAAQESGDIAKLWVAFLEVFEVLEQKPAMERA